MNEPITAINAAPATEPSVVAKPSAIKQLTARARARQMTQLRIGQSGAPSAAPHSSTPAAVSYAPAPAATPRGEAHAPAAIAPAPAPVRPGTVAPEPAVTTAPAGTVDNEDNHNPDAADDASAAPTAPEAGDALALLENDDPTAAAPDTRTEERWIQQLDALLSAGDHPKAIHELQRRLHALVDQRDTERNGRLEAARRLAERDAAGPERPAASEATGGHPALARIDAQVQETLATLTLVEGYLDQVAAARSDGMEVPRHITLRNGQVWGDGNGRPNEVTPEMARDWKRKYELNLSTLTSRRETAAVELQREHRTQTQESMGEALQHYPWLATKTSPEFQEAQALLRERPGLKGDPKWPVVVGDYIAGKRAREAKAGHGRATLTPQAPPMTRPRGGGTPPPAGAAPGASVVALGAGRGRDALSQQVQEARAKYHQSGSAKDRAKFSALQRQQQSAA